MNRRILAFAIVGALVIVGSVVPQGQILADPKPSGTYVALGDSLAVGVGATVLEKKGYVPQFKKRTAARTDLVNLAVSGGIGLLHEDFKGDAADRDDPAISWSYEYDQYFFERFVQAFHNHNGSLNLSHTDEATLRFRWGLRFPMRWGFVATTRFDLDHETEPSPGTEKTDKTFRLSLGYEW